LREFSIQFPSRTAFSHARSLERRWHVVRAIHAGVRLGRVPRLMGSSETDPAEPRFRALVIVKVVLCLLADINIVIFRRWERRRPNQRFIFPNPFLDIFPKSFEQA